MDHKHLDKVNVNFILGPGRCGTTLLMLMLNEHSTSICTPEIKHTLYFYSKYRNITHITEELKTDIETYFGDLIKEGRLNFIYHLNLRSLLDDLKTGEVTTYQNLCKRMYFTFEYKEKNIRNITTVFDKNPFYTLHWEQLNTLYPSAKFILMLRDHRAYVASNYFSVDAFKRKRSIYYHALIWRFYARKVKEIQTKVPEKCCFINYEELIGHTEDGLGTIYKFCHLTPEIENSISFYKTTLQKTAAIDLKKISERLQKKLSDLSKPIYKEGLDSWKKKFTARQIKICDMLCSDVADQFGYAPLYDCSFFEKYSILLRSVLPYLWISFAFNFMGVKAFHYLNVIRRVNKKQING